MSSVSLFRRCAAWSFPSRTQDRACKMQDLAKAVDAFACQVCSYTCTCHAASSEAARCSHRDLAVAAPCSRSACTCSGKVDAGLLWLETFCTDARRVKVNRALTGHAYSIKSGRVFSVLCLPLSKPGKASQSRFTTSQHTMRADKREHRHDGQCDLSVIQAASCCAIHCRHECVFEAAHPVASLALH